MWNVVYDNLKIALLDGNPPLYAQLLVATGLYALLRLYLWLKNRKVKKLSFLRTRWLTGVWLASLVALSFGAYDIVQGFYEDHLLRLYRIFNSLI